MTCQHCGAHAHNAYLCRHCTNNLRTMLLDLVTGPHRAGGLLDDLTDAATGQTRYTDELGHRTPGTRTPRINPRASQLLTDTHATLARIAAHLPHTDTNSAPPTNPTALALWLAAHVITIANQISAEQTYCQLHAITHRILRTIDLPAPTRYVGPCDCGARLKAPLDATHVTCRHCGIEYNLQARQRQLLTELVNNGTAFTPDEFPVALSILGVTYSSRSFRRHRQTGTLPIAGYTNSGEPLYRPVDLPKYGTMC